MKKNKLLIPIMVLILVIGVVGGTLAWLTDKTETVTNTFTVGNVDINLAETTGVNYKMVPGTTLKKDPKVTVNADSEACWLFVKVEKTGGTVTVKEPNEKGELVDKTKSFDDFITYSMANGWTALDGNEGVYYRKVETATADQTFDVLKDNQVVIKGTVSKDMMDAVTTQTQPTLAFTAYAVQKEGFATAGAAWAEANK